MHIMAECSPPRGTARTVGRHSVFPEVLLGRVLEMGIKTDTASLDFPPEGLYLFC